MNFRVKWIEHKIILTLKLSLGLKIGLSIDFQNTFS